MITPFSFSSVPSLPSPFFFHSPNEAAHWDSQDQDARNNGKGPKLVSRIKTMQKGLE